MLGLLLLLAVPIIFFLGMKRPERAILFWLLLSPLSTNALVVAGVDTRILFFDRLGLLVSIITLAANGELRNIVPARFSKFERAFLAFFTIFLLEGLLKFSLRDAFSFWTNTFDCFGIPFYLYLVIRYFLSKGDVQDDEFEGQLVLVLGLVGLYCAPMSIFEGLTGIDLLKGPGEDTLRFKGTSIPRANGPFWEPGALGSYLSWIMLLVLYRWRLSALRTGASMLIRSCVRLPYMLVMVAGLYFVMFRNAWGGFLGGFLVRFLFSARGRITMLVVAIPLSVGLFVVWSQLSQSSLYKDRISNDENIYDRLGAWLYAFRAFSEHPLTGLGPGQIKYYIWKAQEAGDDLRVKGIPATFHPHNTLIAQLAEIGLVGVIPFCLLLVYFMGEVRGCVRLAQTPADREFGIYAVSAAVAIIAPGLSDRCFEWHKSNLLMYVIIGIIVAHHEKLKKRDAQQVEELSSGIDVGHIETGLPVGRTV